MTKSWRDFCDVCEEQSEVGEENTTVILDLTPSYHNICREHFSIFKRVVKWARDRKTRPTKDEIKSKTRKLGEREGSLGKIVTSAEFYLDRDLPVEDKFE